MYAMYVCYVCMYVCDGVVDLVDVTTKITQPGLSLESRRGRSPLQPHHDKTYWSYVLARKKEAQAETNNFIATKCFEYPLRYFVTDQLVSHHLNFVHEHG